jgi:lysophospholipase L1-like esterase
LVKAISFAGSRSGRVFVLSIPDWGLTPFAKEKESRTISEEINAFNQVNQAIALAYQCHYLNITESSREHGNEEMYLTPDKLHYSGAEYKIWAEKLAGAVVKVIDK